MSTHAVYQRDDTRALIAAALAEDLDVAGDRTVQSLVPSTARLIGTLTAKQAGVICGLPLVAQVCDAIQPGAVTIEHCSADGTVVQAGAVVLRCHGHAGVLLSAERTFLNCCQRLSGVATVAARYAAAVAGTDAIVLDTRKTTPGMRWLEKHAVRMGGCRNHRIGLFDQVLIKENHIALHGDADPSAAVAHCRRQVGPDLPIEVEIERLEDLEPVIAAGADIVMLDNLPPSTIAQAVAIRGDRPVALEASGGITLANIRDYAKAGVDRISIGALTHSVTALDLSLRCHIA